MAAHAPSRKWIYCTYSTLPSRRPNLLHIPQLVLINTFVTIRGRTFPGPNGTITKHSSRLSKNGSRRPFRNCICCTPPDALDSCCCSAPSASESSAPGYSRPIHALLLGCVAQPFHRHLLELDHLLHGQRSFLGDKTITWPHGMREFRPDAAGRSICRPAPR